MRKKGYNIDQKLVEQLIRSLFDGVIDVKFKSSNNNMVVNIMLDRGIDNVDNDDLFMDDIISKEIRTFTGIRTAPIWNSYSFNSGLDDLYVSVNFKEELTETTKKRVNIKTIIGDIMEKFVMLEQDICGYDIEENFNLNINSYEPKLTLYFKEKYKKRLNEFYDIMNEIWSIIYDFTGIAVSLYSKFDNKYCKKNINENTSNDNKYLEIINQIIDEYRKNNKFSDITVNYDDEDDIYDVIVLIDGDKINDQSFSVFEELKFDIRNTLNLYLPSFKNIYIGLRSI